MSENGRRGRAEHRVTGDIAWKIRYARERFDPRVHLAGPGIEIEIFYVPATDGGVHFGHIEQGQVAGPTDLAIVLGDEVRVRDIVPVSRRRIGAGAIGP